MSSIAGTAGVGAVSNAYAFYAQIDTLGGNITTGSAFYVKTGSFVGVLTTQYGLYIENLTGATNDYGIYAAGADTLTVWIDAGSSRFDTSSITVASGASAVLRAFTVGTPGSTDTVTISGSTNITTATGFNHIEIQAPTYSNASIVVTNGSPM